MQKETLSKDAKSFRVKKLFHSERTELGYEHSCVSRVLMRYCDSTGGHTMPICALNSFVHIIMYIYYLLLTVKPELRTSMWWKKYITQLQLVSISPLEHLAHNIGVYSYSGDRILKFYHKMTRAEEILHSICSYYRRFLFTDSVRHNTDAPPIRLHSELRLSERHLLRHPQ